MTAPGLAAARFLIACLLGLPLGLWYGFLRPLRPRFSGLADGLFLLGALGSLLYLGFGICRGDLRIGYGAGLMAGGFLWEITAGQLLRRPFSGFWGFVRGILRKIRRFRKKFFKKAKILFASGEKWVTIKWNNRRHSRQKPGGKPHGKIRKSLPQREGNLPPQPSPDQGSGDRGYRVVYGGPADPALDHS